MIKTLFMLLFIPIISFSQKDYSRDLHMVAGNVVSTGVGITTYKLTNKMGVSIVAGFASGILIGIAKEEIYDKRWGKGTYSKWDMMDTGWGSLIGSAMVTVYIDVNRKNKQERIEWKQH